MDIEKLESVFSEQENNLNNLIDTALRKRNAVIQNNRDDLERINHAEEILLNDLRTKENERVDLLKRMMQGPENNVQKISGNLMEQFMVKFRGSMQEEEYDKLSLTRERVKEKVDKLTNINKQNTLLIEQANHILKHTLSIILKSQKKPLLDRKI